MIDTQMYAHLLELAHRRRDGREQRPSRHRGLQRSAREISLEERRQRRHGEAA
ncbi:hypothetical protein [Humibacillus xanthopallidus]|uniref:Uncharacterized protein n=1 Tax=Humibacillus xanthopallidus TaxID=412689 RepID=A0A543I243_9MICO|nr:hypothetical protein [Humibacillus xanthopallidus]TQM64654.1 hypothetical protein FBY41_1029 [Humibacillus xanthopallidus]